MRKFILAAVLAAVAALAGVSSVFAADKVTGEVSLGVMSNYVFRGFELSKDSLSIQPSVEVGYKGFAAKVSGYDDTNVYVNSAPGYGTNRWTETDIDLSYTRAFGMFDATVGYIYYAFPGGYDTQEVYGRVKANTLLNPTLTVYRDFDHFAGYYITLGVSHDITINDKAKVVLEAQAGYLAADDASSYAKVGTTKAYSAFHDGVIGVSVPYKVTNTITVAPVLRYSFALSNDARDLIKTNSPEFLNTGTGGDSNYVYGGVVASMKF